MPSYNFKATTTWYDKKTEKSFKVENKGNIKTQRTEKSDVEYDIDDMFAGSFRKSAIEKIGHDDIERENIEISYEQE